MSSRATATLDGMEVVEVHVPADVVVISRQPSARLTMLWEGEVVIEDPGLPPVRAAAGDVLYHPPGFACSARFVTECIMLTVEIAEVKMQEFVTVLADPAGPLLLPARHLGHITAGIRRELHGSRPGRAMVLASLITQLVVLAARSAAVTLGRRLPDCVERVRELLRVSYAAPPSPVEIARMMGVSREHLTRNFRAHVGMTISEFVRSVRIDRARDLLVDPILSLGVVALNSGFYDQSHMNRTFRMALGMTPSQYRRSLHSELGTESAVPAEIDRMT